MDIGQTIYDTKLRSTWEAQEASPQHLQQLVWRDPDLVSDCQLLSPSLVPSSQLRTNQRKSNMLPNQSHKVPAFIGLPPASHANTLQPEPPETFPFSHYQTFPLPCLPLSLCQTQAVVADWLVLASASSKLIASVCYRLGLRLFLQDLSLTYEYGEILPYIWKPKFVISFRTG